MKKKSLWKNFLYFEKWNFLAPILKNSYISIGNLQSLKNQFHILFPYFGMTADEAVKEKKSLVLQDDCWWSRKTKDEIFMSALETISAEVFNILYSACKLLKWGEIQNGSKIKIQKGFKIKIQNSFKLKIQNISTVEIQKSSNFTYVLI